MADLPISSCWLVYEGLSGLKNQAIGLAQALGVPYAAKEIKKAGVLKQWFFPLRHGLNPPWPDLLISCGCQSAPVSSAVRQASSNRTFTVHIQDPMMDPEKFDVVIAPAHDKVRGSNVFLTKGAVHQITAQKLSQAAGQFRPLFEKLPRPLISVLVGGKNRHQDFSVESIHDFAGKLLMAAAISGGGLAITTSRRTGKGNEAILRQNLSGVPAFIWDGQGENPYFGLLALAQAIVVTSDSISMISEACSTGKPVYIYEIPNGGRRHKQLCKDFFDSGIARPFLGMVETWDNQPLDETRKAADFVAKHYAAKMQTTHAASGR